MTDKRGTGTFVTDNTELTTGNLDFFTPPIIEHVLREGKTIEISCGRNISDSGPFEFKVAGDADNYIYLPLTRLNGSVQILKSADSKKITDADVVSVCNLFPQSLFKQVEISVANTQVNDLSSSTYPIKAFMETVLTYGADAKKTHLTLAGWEADQVGKENETTENSGWVKRKKKIVGKTYHFSMIIHADFLQMERFLLPNIDLEIKLIRNTDDYSLISATQIGKINILNLSLSVHKVKIANEFNNAIKTNLTKEVALYPITQSKIKVFSCPLNGTKTIFPNVSQGKLPQSMVIGFLHEKSFNGDVTFNPFHFNNFGLNLLDVKVNGTPFYPKPLQPKYNDGDYKREYRMLLDNTGIHHGNMTSDITEEEFVHNCNFYPFDFTPDLCNSVHHHSISTGNIDIEICFQSPTTHGIYMIVYAAYPQTITISGDNRVTLIE